MKMSIIKYLIVVLLVIWFYHYFFVGKNSVFKISEYSRDISNLEKDTLLLHNKLKKVEKRMKLLEKGDKYEIERDAREKYDYKKVGEKIYKYKVKKGD